MNLINARCIEPAIFSIFTNATKSVQAIAYDQLPQPLSHRFWDVDMQKLDYETNARFIIEKVMNYGLWADILEILRYYGRDRIKTEVIQAAYLKKKTLSFCCAIFDLSPQQFRCYTRQQSNQLPWNF